MYGVVSRRSICAAEASSRDVRIGASTHRWSVVSSIKKRHNSKRFLPSAVIYSHSLKTRTTGRELPVAPKISLRSKARKLALELVAGGKNWLSPSIHAAPKPCFEQEEELDEKTLLFGNSPDSPAEPNLHSQHQSSDGKGALRFQLQYKRFRRVKRGSDHE